MFVIGENDVVVNINSGDKINYINCIWCLLRVLRILVGIFVLFCLIFSNNFRK